MYLNEFVTDCYNDWDIKVGGRIYVRYNFNEVDYFLRLEFEKEKWEDGNNEKLFMGILRQRFMVCNMDSLV